MATFNFNNIFGGYVKYYSMVDDDDLPPFQWPIDARFDFAQQAQPAPQKIDLGWFEVVDMVETDGVWMEV